MPKLTIYVSTSLSEKLKHHKGLNISEVASRALDRTISSSSCMCESCREKERQFMMCQQLTSAAVKNGVLSPQPCEICRYIEVHAHHPDYNKPLDVRWLCSYHHMIEHNAVQKRSVFDVAETAREEVNILK